MTDQPPPHPVPYGQPPGAPPPPGYTPPPGYGPAPGYGDPYGAGYDPRFGYGPPGVPQYPSQSGPVRPDDTTWAMMSYVLTLLVGFPGPLILYLVKKKESPFVRYHAAQALNIEITYLLHILIALAVGGGLALAFQHPAPLVIAFVPVLLFHAVAQLVLLILGAVRASKGVVNRFPTWLCFRIVR
ncbi:UNVERIFIED_ORG: hypothetical protein CLV66_10816 [Actinomadura viridilutea]|uniref:DUF4870 domain-containing protein n=1 Tax=Actinomadura rubrobrunea TaxID=115335 RepID=UPI00082AE19D|nr:DUF4870 domain-containing protein [Actinomadura rubrobrunea]